MSQKQEIEESWRTTIMLKERHKEKVKGDGFFNLSEFVRNKLDEEVLNDE